MASKVLQQMLDRKGLDYSSFRPNSRLGSFLRKNVGVPDHPEIHRIAALPRRAWTDTVNEELIQELTEWLKVPGGTQEVRHIQAAVLTELNDVGGVIAPITVGGGKTLISRLAPLVVEAERPVLLIPGGLREKTEREFKKLDAHWRSHPNLQIVSYQKLGRESGENILDEIQPDLIIADEVQKLKNLQAGCTRRVARYMKAHPKTIFLGMSGTITKRSLMDFHHLLYWALGPDNMPLPGDPRLAIQWALAVDEKVELGQRLLSGALKIFVGKEKPTLKNVRISVGERIRSTPGVVSMLSDDGVDASICMEYWNPPVPPGLLALAETVSREKRTPDGDIILDPADVWRHIRELVCGFYYTWAEEPPEDWMRARSQWRKFAREILDDNLPGLDTERQVRSACEAYKLRRDFYDAWMDIQGTYTPVRVPKWESTDVLEALASMCSGRELIWVEHIVVGEKLSEITGYPYFNKGGVFQGKPIESLEGKSAILSIASNKEGRNLQVWSHNIVVTPPSDGGTWEQLLGRTHRFGQEADEVTALVMLGHSAVESSMEQAFADARYQQALTGAPHKLLLADTSRIFQQGE